MEFLLYLSPVGKEIYNMISQKIRVVENSPICAKHNIYGWYQSTNSTMIFCTARIKSGSNVEKYVNETLFHESVHLAQSCKNRMGNLLPLGISASSMKLSTNQQNDLNKSVSKYGNSHLSIEREAYWMEDKPGKVKYAIQKYCF